MNPQIVSKIDAVANKAIDNKMTPGLQILVAKKGKVIYQKSFGYHTYENIKKVENTDVYDIASLTKIISTLPSGILTFYETSDHYKLSKEQYETVCKITKIIPQRAVMGANLINFKATQIYTTNGNQIAKTFVNWDEEENKCIAGFVLIGSVNGGTKEEITVSGEVLNFLSTTELFSMLQENLSPALILSSNSSSSVN